MRKRRRPARPNNAIVRHILALAQQGYTPQAISDLTGTSRIRVELAIARHFPTNGNGGST